MKKCDVAKLVKFEMELNDELNDEGFMSLESQMDYEVYDW